MDLVAGYGSDSSGGSPPASAEPTPAPAVAPALPSWASARETASSEGLLTSLPAPSDQPKRKKRKTLPMTLQYVPDSDEEDQPNTKVRVSSKGKSLTEFLPPPKQLNLAASGGGKSVSRQRAASPDSSPDHLLTEGMPESTIHVDAPVYPAEIGNEAYRMEQQAEGNTAELDQYGNSYVNGALPVHAQAPQHAVRAQPQQQHDLLEQTLAEEMSKAARRSGKASAAPPGVKFKQVNQTDLTYVNPAQREAAGGARTALGTEYELQLRREAGPKPGKQANRKHQISSLYHLSKVRELEDLERRGQGIKTKMETQAKYGW